MKRTTWVRPCRWTLKDGRNCSRRARIKYSGWAVTARVASERDIVGVWFCSQHYRPAQNLNHAWHVAFGNLD